MSSTVASFEVSCEEQTERIGQCFAQCLAESLMVCFQGDLGAGKTTLIRSILRALGVTGPVKSPTFSVVESYDEPQVIHHFDLYRLTDPEELEMIGFRDYLTTEALCFIEWPERASFLLSEADIRVELSLIDFTKRILKISADTEKGRRVFTSLLRAYHEVG
jgi:tRNA threonylcarbamoyladenosine biosynthesis protein TsaE